MTHRTHFRAVPDPLVRTPSGHPAPAVHMQLESIDASFFASPRRSSADAPPPCAASGEIDAGAGALSTAAASGRQRGRAFRSLPPDLRAALDGPSLAAAPPPRRAYVTAALVDFSLILSCFFPRIRRAPVFVPFCSRLLRGEPGKKKKARARAARRVHVCAERQTTCAGMVYSMYWSVPCQCCLPPIALCLHRTGRPVRLRGQILSAPSG
jgi:hypothetical protein